MIRLDAVTHVYGRSRSSVRALDGVSLEFRRGTFTAVMGPSGSGKSTPLHCAAGMDRLRAMGGITLVTFSQGATGSPLPSVSMATYAVIVATTAAIAAPSILIAGRRALSRSEDALVVPTAA